jgi:RES domain-containing protein
VVLWTWGPDLPHNVNVFDPTGRLPKNQLSWD